MNNLERMGKLLNWYRENPTTDNQRNYTGTVWEDLWRVREPRLIPIETDGPSRLTAFIIDQLQVSSPHFRPQTMIEVGSGPGSRSIQLAKKYALSLCLLDNSFNALNLHAKPLSKKVDNGNFTYCVQGSMLEAPFPDNSFDISFAYGPHDHFFGTDRQLAFDEMYRITSEGGIGITIVPSQLNPFWTAEMIQKVWQDTWEFGPTKFFTPKELTTRMENAGYNNVQLYGASFFTSWLRLLPKSEQVKRYDKPTSFGNLNDWLAEKNLDFESFLNRYLGGDIMALGVKPIVTG